VATVCNKIGELLSRLGMLLMFLCTWLSSVLGHCQLFVRRHFWS